MAGTAAPFCLAATMARPINASVRNGRAAS